MDYLKRAVELAKASLDAGQFPAGAVLVSKNGAVYESKPSLAYNHGETMVIDMAIASEGAPLVDATIYASMHPCLMCSSKMYWAGIKNVEYVIPKSAVNAAYCYENSEDVDEIIKTFHDPITMTHIPTLQNVAIELYNTWVQKIEAA